MSELLSRPGETPGLRLTQTQKDLIGGSIGGIAQVLVGQVSEPTYEKHAASSTHGARLKSRLSAIRYRQGPSADSPAGDSRFAVGLREAAAQERGAVGVLQG